MDNRFEDTPWNLFSRYGRLCEGLQLGKVWPYLEREREIGQTSSAVVQYLCSFRARARANGGVAKPHSRCLPLFPYITLKANP